MSIALDLPLGQVRDPGLPTLSRALDPFFMQRLFRLHAAPVLGARALHLDSLALVRHKPGRRVLVEYRVRADGTPLVLLGKVRGKGADRRAFATLQALRAAGLAEPNRVVVPEPVALLPEVGMLVMRQMPGTPWLDHGDRATELADALVTLQHLPSVNPRYHSAARELQILERELGDAAAGRPWLARRIGQVLERCGGMLPALDAGPRTAVHRDFYHDQVLVDGPRIVLLDLDDYAVGHPALDAGNFVAHLLELGLRTGASAAAYAGPIAAFTRRWLAGQPGVSPPMLEHWTTVSLARHIGLSGRLRGREHSLELVLRLVESRLAGGTR